MKVHPVGWILLVIWMLPNLAHGETPQLEPLRYNHPGLAVDLNVGLWAWPLPCDADGDGDFDLIVSCPDKPSNGIWLFENTTRDTADDKFPVFAPARRLSSTVHYVMPSYTDQGMRVLSPGFEYEDVPHQGLQKRTSLPVPASFYKPRGTQTKGPKVRHNQWRYVDYDGDGALDLIVGIEDWSFYGWDDAWDSTGSWTNGPLHGFVFVFQNLGSTEQPQYADPTQVMAGDGPLDVYGCPSPNFADFDGDGDLDLLCGEFLDQFTYFENVGTRTEPRYAEGRRPMTPAGTPVTMDLQMIVPIAFDWDRDGDMDLIVGDEDGRVALVENTGELEEDRVPVFNPPRYFQQQADALDAGALATPFAYDWDSDGDQDLLCGNTAGYILWFENLSGPGVAEPRWNAPQPLTIAGEPFRVMAGSNGSIQGPAEAKWGYTTLYVADWDGDGQADVLFNSIWGRVQWMRNIGEPGAPKLAAPESLTVAWDGEPPTPDWTWWQPAPGELVTQWRTTPIAEDWNGDGLVDLIMLDHEGYLALFERAIQDDQRVLLPPRRVLYGENLSVTDSRHKVLDDDSGPLRLNRGEAGGSGRRKLFAADWDQDGRVDLLVNSTNANLLRQTDHRDGKWYFSDQGPLFDSDIQGHTTSPCVVDFDGDGRPEFLGGAEDGRLYYARRKSRQDAILTSEFVYESAPFPSCHASTLAVTPDGTVVCAWFGGEYEKHPDVGIWVSRRVDGRWSPPVEVANGVQYTGFDGNVHRHPCWNPVLHQPQDGPLMLFYKVGPTPDAWWGMLMTSDDGGESWSVPRRLPEGIDGPVKNKPLALADGTLLCPSSTEHDGWRIHMERTSDLGYSWQRSAPLNDGKDFSAIQPSILVLGDGHLMAVGRTRQGRLFQIESMDGGNSWGEMTATDLPNPSSGTDAVTLQDGRHLLVYNHTPSGRTPLNVAVSDDARTWHGTLVLESEPGEYSYPAIIQGPDGTVHISYTWRRERIRYLAIDPEQLPRRDMSDGHWPNQ